MRFIPIIIFNIIATGLCLMFLQQHQFIDATKMHLTSAVLGLITVYFGRDERRLPSFEITLAMGVPVFGGLCASYYSLATSGQHKSGTFEDYQEHLAKDLEYNNTTKTFTPDPERLLSLFSILKSDQPLLEKRTAIEALAQLETPESVATLRKALSLESVEVRFFAASILSKIESKLTDSLKKRDLRATRTTASALDYFNLAQSYFDFSYYNIAEGEREKNYLKKAKMYINKINPKQADSKVYELAGRIDLGLHDYKSALACFTTLAKTSDNPQTALLWCAEANYYCGKFAETALCCQQAATFGTIPLRIKHNIDFWLENISA